MGEVRVGTKVRGVKDNKWYNKVWRVKDSSNCRNCDSEFSHSLWGGRCYLVGRETMRMDLGPQSVLCGEDEEEKCLEEQEKVGRGASLDEKHRQSE